MSGHRSAAAPGDHASPAPSTPSAAGRPDVLLVTEVFPPAIGGSGLLLREVYRRLPQHTVTVVTDAVTSAGPETRLSPSLRIERCALATRAWGLGDIAGNVHHLRVSRRIRRSSDRTRTVVHCGRALPEGIAAWVNHALGGARYICWSHGEDVSMARTSRELTWVMTRVFRSAAAVIANSRNTRESILGLGIPGDRVHVVYPGVDPDLFHPGVDARSLRDILLRGGDTVLLSVGRLQRRKGHDLAIEAMAMLKTSCPGLRYVIVGEGEERARLEGLVTSHGLDSRIAFAGAVPESALPSYFAASDVFVMPNRQDGADIEGFGIVFLEAAAAGRPSIGGNSGGVPEAVDHGRTGLLVGGIDPRELAGAIERLVADPSERLAFGLAGRERVLQGFTWDHAAALVARIHNDVRAYD